MRSEKSSSCLSSVVLDTSEEIRQKKISKGNQFIYRFVRQDLPPLNGEAHDGDSLSSGFSSTDDINCALRSGDYVVCIIPTLFFISIWHRCDCAGHLDMCDVFINIRNSVHIL